jgi:hypothetical protein
MLWNAVSTASAGNHARSIRLSRLRMRAKRSKHTRLMPDAIFHQSWYADDQLRQVCDAGAILEIKCWEGRSTTALANACYPESFIDFPLREAAQHV